MASIIDTTRIVDLPTKSSLSEGDVFVVDNENGATSKIPAAAVSGSSTAGLVAEGYSDAETYDVGEYCIHVEAGIPKLYKCTTAITTAESWTPAHWEGTDAGSEITELNSNLAELQTSKLDASNYVKAQNGSFPLLLHSGELWLIAVNRLSAPDAYVCLAHLYNGTVQVSNVYKSSTFSVDTNSQGTLTFKYTGSTTGVQGGAYRLM